MLNCAVAYKHADINTASPLGLVIKTFDFMILNLEKMLVPNAELDPEYEVYKSNVTYKLMDLSTSIDQTVDSELPAILTDLYAWCITHLCKNTELRAVKLVLIDLRDGFKSIS